MILELLAAGFVGGVLGLLFGARHVGAKMLSLLLPLYRVAEAAQMAIDCEAEGDYSAAREWREELELALNHYRVERWWLEMTKQRAL